MKLTDINVRDPFILIENGKTYIYRTLCQNATEGEEKGFCVFISKDEENFEKKVVFRANESFWADRDYWAPEVHKIDGKYYMFASFKSADRRRASHILTCDTPDGVFVPLSEQLTPYEWECLDATYFEDNGKRYTVFCHEWLQCGDGEMILAELDEKFCIRGELKKLFNASSAPWAREHQPKKYVTDGPFLYRLKSGRILMLWSSFGEEGYAMGMATADRIDGEWQHVKKPLVSKNGGHGMLFEKDGKLFVTYHLPNNPASAERAYVAEVIEKNGVLEIKEDYDD